MHIERDECEAKFWLAPVQLERSRSFSRTELRRIEALVEERSKDLLRFWNDYFGH